MRILMIAPEPFFEPRGTPFSEYHRIKALGELGHQVDLVTYPIGRDVPLPGLRIHRTLRPPFVSKVRIGPSVTKLLLDGLMLLMDKIGNGDRTPAVLKNTQLPDGAPEHLEKLYKIRMKNPE